MRICLASQTFHPQDEGGAEISARHAAEALSADHEVTVLALGKAGDATAPLGEVETAAPYRLHRLRFRNAYLPLARRADVSLAAKIAWHLRAAQGALDPQEVRRILRELRPDVLYANNSAYMQPVLFREAHRAGIPIAMHLRDYAVLCPRVDMRRAGKNCPRPCLDCRVLRAPARSAFGRVSHAIAVSAFVRDRLLAGGALPGAEWHVLHNRNLARAPQLCRAPVAGRPFTFGFLGAVTPEKGIEALLAAFETLPPGTARLLIGGRGADETMAALRSRTAGKAVEWLGFVAPATLLAQVDMVVVPSLWHEPQSRVLIEAPAAGVPVLASRRGGSTEVVEGYRTGWTFEPDEPGAFARCLSAAAAYTPAHWAAALPALFPGLAGFEGTAEGSGYYQRLERILEACAASRTAVT
ncbi:MAG: glycosyltransferase [Pikeienuella sp.]